jgi:hypothetical protein
MLTPGAVTKGYIFVCLRCRTQEVLVSSTQAKAEKYARSKEIGWSKKEFGGWHCPKCKRIEPNEAEQKNGMKMRRRLRRRRYICSVCVRYNILQYSFLVMDHIAASQLVCEECAHERDHQNYTDPDCKFCSRKTC